MLPRGLLPDDLFPLLVSYLVGAPDGHGLVFGSEGPPSGTESGSVPESE